MVIGDLGAPASEILPWADCLGWATEEQLEAGQKWLLIFAFKRKRNRRREPKQHALVRQRVFVIILLRRKTFPWGNWLWEVKKKQKVVAEMRVSPVSEPSWSSGGTDHSFTSALASPLLAVHGTPAARTVPVWCFCSYDKSPHGAGWWNKQFLL